RLQPLCRPAKLISERRNRRRAHQSDDQVDSIQHLLLLRHNLANTDLAISVPADEVVPRMKSHVTPDKLVRQLIYHHAFDLRSDGVERSDEFDHYAAG